ncbi:MAG: hypothetical protein L0G37_20510, partial [Pseudomonas sp.]|nr:hypothetical protein [Pseudomonas sp.]
TGVRNGGIGLQRPGCSQTKQVAKSPRGPKVPKPKTWVKGTAVNAHVSTDRIIKAAKTKRP